jgi:hypothetical protein
MKEHLLEIVRSETSPARAFHSAREYLQALILESLQRSGAMLTLAFHGGTALRFLYSSRRFSEDLDFALERPGPEYDFRGQLLSIQSRLRSLGFSPELKVSDRKTVHSAFVRLPGLLFEAGLSPHRSQVLSVKIEVDTRPPPGAGLETTVVRRLGVTLQLQHHDRASLFSGKLHAILARPFPKGRDFYDLLWYLSDPAWPEPNLVLLGNALKQTGWTGPLPTPASWRRLVRGRLRGLPWERIRADVTPFLESGDDAGLVTPENLSRLLRDRAPNARR